MCGLVLLRFENPMERRKLNAIIVRMSMHGFSTGMEQLVLEGIVIDANFIQGISKPKNSMPKPN